MASTPQASRIYRPATVQDRTLLAALLATSSRKHQHLDWVDSTDLLGKQPFFLALEGNLPIGCLACPPDPPGVAWIRLFSVAAVTPCHQVWEQLWPVASTEAGRAGADRVAALLLENWMAPLLIASGFRQSNAVVFLKWQAGPLPPDATHEEHIRPMQADDLEEVLKVDWRAFKKIWRQSIDSLTEALRQAALATVIEHSGRPVAYQVSTATRFGAHLARLAVDPSHQGRGLGRTLVLNLLRTFQGQGLDRITVNTQADNEPSLRLYDRLGFRRTGQQYPVFEIDL